MDGPLEYERAKFHSGAPKVLQKITHCFLRCRPFIFESDSDGPRYKETAAERITQRYLKTVAPEGKKKTQLFIFGFALTVVIGTTRDKLGTLCPKPILFGKRAIAG